MNLIPLILAVPLCGALCTALCGKKHGGLAHYIALAAEAVVLALAAAALLGNGGLDSFRLPAAGGLSFDADGFRIIWIVLICFAFLMSGLTCPEYFSRASARYQITTLLTLTGTLGVFLAADLFTFFVFFELMSLSSWLWVIHEENDSAKYAADTYLAVAVLGGLVMLMGIFTLVLMTGEPPELKWMSLMSGFQGGYAAMPQQGLRYLAGGLMLFGFAAKVGLFPLHFWLPMAYPAAPAPSSALLSGVLTKCGVLGMLILASTLFRADRLWGELILGLGVITMVLGALLAVCSVDLKRTLACSSVSQIGFISVGVGLMSLLGDGNILAVRGTILHMINHTLIKLVLFLAAGVFAMNRGTLDLNRLRGAGKGNLPLMLVFLTGAYSVAGLPGGSGYLSKTMLHEAIVEYTAIAERAQGVVIPQLHIVEWLFLFSGGLTLAYMLKLFVTLFLSGPVEKAGKPLRMNAGTMAALTIPSIVLWVLGLAANPLTDRLLDRMQPIFNVSEALQMRYFSLSNLSGACISIAAGVLVYFLLVRPLLTREGALVNIIPAWCDLERNLYRPVFLRLLPNAAGLACRLVDCSLDGLVVLLRKMVLRDLGRPKRAVAGLWLTDSLGRLCDRLVSLANRTFRRKHPIERRSFVYTFAEKEREFAASGRLITASLSFGMLLACVGLVATLLYLLF